MKNQAFKVVGMLFLAFGLFLINFGSVAHAKENVIKIGAIDPLTGPAAKFGEIISKLLHKVVDSTNASGGIDLKGEKYLIELKEYDDESMNDKARAAAERLATVDKVSVIAATFRSPGSIAVEPVAKKYSIPTFTAGFTPRVNYAGTWMFRANPSTLMDYYMPMKYIYENTNFRNIGIIAEEGDWGDDTLAFLEWWVKTYGGTLKVLGRFPFAAKDFHPLITSVKMAKRKGDIDVLFVQSWASALELFIKQANSAGLDKELPLLTGTGGGDFISIKDVSPQVDGWIMATTYNLINYADNPEIRKIFSAETLAAYDKYKAMQLPLSAAAMTTYTNLMACLEAIKKAGTTDSVAIRKALASLSMDTLAGKVQWTDYGQPELTMKLIKWQNVDGKIVPKVLSVDKVPALIELPPKNFPEIKVLKGK